MKNQIIAKNLEKFRQLDKFALPVDQYAITASGPLGIRGIREINDIDIIVSDELWASLAEKYGVTDSDGVKKIVFPGSDIEVLGEGSFYTRVEDEEAPTVAGRIASSEIIEGLPFESLEHVIYYKHKMGREKDLRDIAAAEEWLRHNL